MSEHSDAVVVIVSEETGGISIAVEIMIQNALLPMILLIVVFFVIAVLPAKRIEFLYEIDKNVPALALLLLLGQQLAAQDRRRSCSRIFSIPKRRCMTARSSSGAIGSMRQDVCCR